MILQGFKLFPRDRIETTDPFYRLIPTLPIVVELVGGICLLYTSPSPRDS